jgi:hypothetical protein
MMLTVFPFDFSAYQFDWEIVARFVLVLAIIGSSIGALVEAIKLVSSLPPTPTSTGRNETLT